MIRSFGIDLWHEKVYSNICQIGEGNEFGVFLILKYAFGIPNKQPIWSGPNGY